MAVVAVAKYVVEHTVVVVVEVKVGVRGGQQLSTVLDNVVV